VITLFTSLLPYSASASPPGLQTQAIVAEAATDGDRNSVFSLYFLLGFLSKPYWVLFTGYLTDCAGFATAVTMLSVTYVVDIVVVSFMDDERRAVESVLKN
jgi:hypothetical protein